MQNSLPLSMRFTQKRHNLRPKQMSAFTHLINYSILAKVSSTYVMQEQNRALRGLKTTL